MNTQLSPGSMRVRRRGRTGLVMVGLIIIVLAALAAAVFYYLYVPNKEHVKADFGGQSRPVFYNGIQLPQEAQRTGEQLMLSFDTIQSQFDSTILYEEANKSLIITTKDSVLRMKTAQLDALFNGETMTLQFPTEMIDDILYVPFAAIKQIYQLTAVEDTDTGAVMLTRAGDLLQHATVLKGQVKGTKAAVRTKPGIKQPIVADLEQGSLVTIWDDVKGWYRVQTDSGVMGYLAKKDASLERPELIAEIVSEPKPIPWKPLGGKIVAAWEQVTLRTPDMTDAPEMSGLNVVSPTWFRLIDGAGNIANIADTDYVNWAHGRGLQVWGLFSNDFEQAKTTDALADYDTRLFMIRQLLSFVKLYNLQGINLDFENVALSDGPQLTQFVRELTPFMHEAGLVVSIDVTFKSTSDNWSRFYDRKALGEIVDYMMIMAYDEHWAASPVAGSVASMPWVEQGLLRIMEEDGVPASKIVLGVPFYTRIWTETTVDGKSEVSSKAVSMGRIKELLAEHKVTPVFDETSGQNYAQFTDQGNTVKIWIEDAVSMQARAALVHKFDLAGIAAWRRGFELDEIWPAIGDVLEKRP